MKQATWFALLSSRGEVAGYKQYPADASPDNPGTLYSAEGRVLASVARVTLNEAERLTRMDMGWQKVPPPSWYVTPAAVKALQRPAIVDDIWRATAVSVLLQTLKDLGQQEVADAAVKTKLRVIFKRFPGIRRGPIKPGSLGRCNATNHKER